MEINSITVSGTKQIVLQEFPTLSRLVWHSGLVQVQSYPGRWRRRCMLHSNHLLRVSMAAAPLCSLALRLTKGTAYLGGRQAAVRSSSTLSSYFPTRCLEKIASQPHASAATWRGGHGACLQGLLRRFGRLVHREGLAQCLEYSESYVRKTYHCCNSSSDHY